MKYTLFTSFHGGGTLGKLLLGLDQIISKFPWFCFSNRISSFFCFDFLVTFALGLSSGSLNACTYAMVAF